jgi:hypothetical protein
MEWSLILLTDEGRASQGAGLFGRSFTFTPSHWSLQLLEPWKAQIFLAAGATESSRLTPVQKSLRWDGRKVASSFKSWDTRTLVTTQTATTQRIVKSPKTLGAYAHSVDARFQKRSNHHRQFSVN